MPTQHPASSDETHPQDDQTGQDQTVDGHRNGRPTDDRYRPEVDDPGSAYTQGGSQNTEVISGDGEEPANPSPAPAR